MRPIQINFSMMLLSKQTIKKNRHVALSLFYLRLSVSYYRKNKHTVYMNMRQIIDRQIFQASPTYTFLVLFCDLVILMYDGNPILLAQIKTECWVSWKNSVKFAKC